MNQKFSSREIGEWVKIYNRMIYTLKTTHTYMSKSEAYMHSKPWVEWGQDGPPYEFEKLLSEAINLATEIVKGVPDEFFGVGGGYDSSKYTVEDAARLVEALAERRGRIARLRRIEVLERPVEGRSPEETAAYMEKAKELRQKMDQDG
jgi:hypothetical protein